MKIKLTWLGHSCFRVEYHGYSIVIDPFEPGSVPGFDDIAVMANQVLCTHEHHDHSYRAGVTLAPEQSCPFQITAFPSWHDDQNGALRGENTIYQLEAGGLRVVHFGDVGCMPEQSVLDALRGADAIMLPVGGHYTVDARGAKEIVDAVRPRVTLPMHYRSDSFGYDVLAPLDDFLAICGRWVRCEGHSFSVVPGLPAHTAVLHYEKPKPVQAEGDELWS